MYLYLSIHLSNIGRKNESVLSPIANNITQMWQQVWTGVQQVVERDTRFHFQTIVEDDLELRGCAAQLPQSMMGQKIMINKRRSSIQVCKGGHVT